MLNPLADFHPLHLAYLLFPPHYEENNLENLFAALKSIEPLEREKIIGTATFLLAVEYDRPDATDEEIADARLERFQGKCDRLLREGVADFFLASAIVTITCNYLYMMSDAAHERDSIEGLRGFSQFVRERSESGEARLGFADEISRLLEERMNNSKADRKLARERYELFCDRVVRSMLPQIAGELG